MNPLNEKLKTLRIQKGYSQEELGEKSGVSIRTIQRIEKGENEPRGATLQLLCQALDLSVVEINTLDDKSAPLEIREDNEVYKTMYLVVLIGIVVPVGNIIAPFLVWKNNEKKESKIQQVGKHIVYNQILYTVLSIILLVCWVLGKIEYIGSIDYVIWFVYLLGIINYVLSIYAYVRIRREESTCLPYPFFKKVN